MSNKKLGLNAKDYNVKTNMLSKRLTVEHTSTLRSECHRIDSHQLDKNTSSTYYHLIYMPTLILMPFLFRISTVHNV